MLVGDVFDREAAAAGLPLVGSAGGILNGMLSQVGIERAHCYVTNVFNLQPQPTNDIVNLCGPKATALPGYGAVQSGKYIRAEFAGEVMRLYTEIKNYAPTLIIALGSTAAWALLGVGGIRKIRGSPTVLQGPARTAVGSDIKILPTYHPIAVRSEYTLRPVVIADLEKAKRESAFPELRRPRREIWVAPTLADLELFEHEFILPSNDLSADIETAMEQITCVGFAPSAERAIVVPITDPLQPDGNYWRSLDDELEAWSYIRRWLSLAKNIGGQNFLYDTHYLWRKYGIAIPHASFDTMLMHHAMQPEMEKGLGYLATIYTDELAWKFMRPKHETLKQED